MKERVVWLNISESCRLVQDSRVGHMKYIPELPG